MVIHRFHSFIQNGNRRDLNTKITVHKRSLLYRFQKHALHLKRLRAVSIALANSYVALIRANIPLA